MIRINLLPPETIEKRKAERRWVYVLFAAVGVFSFLFLFFLVMYIQVSSAQAEVAAKQQEAQALQAQAGSFKVFEDRQTELAARQAVADKALKDRVTWSKLFTEVSLVLPADTWLETFRGDEKGIAVTGKAVNHSGDLSSMGFKPVAKLMVRMSDLEQLQNVWLDSSKTDVYLGKPVLDFSLGAELVKPNAEKAASVPAPPSQP